MATMDGNNALKIKECDRNVKNKFILKWFEMVSVNVGKLETTVSIGEDFVKIELPGLASCKLCSKQINYGSRGFVAFEDHAKSSKHTELLKNKVSSHRIDTLKKPYMGDGPSDESVSQASQTTKTPTVVPMCNRISNAEATVLAVVAEHGMPLSCTPILVNLAKTLTKDPKALSEIKLDRTAASYKTKYGLAESFHLKLVNKLRKCPFSLKLDEATSSSNKKVLTVLASFYDDDIGKVKIEHLQSIEIKKTNSETIFNEVVRLIEGNDIPWVNLTSVLMDSCSVMRGSKSGVETRLRREKAPHLLDVDGDSCHHMHNSSKKLRGPFDHYLERLFNDLHADFQYCSEYAGFLSDICGILGVTYSKPARFIPHRWLSAYDMSVQTTLLFKAYVVFYFSFLKGEDKHNYKDIVDKILKDKEFSVSGRIKIKTIQAALTAKKMTEDGKLRKKRICMKVLMTDNTTKLQLSFYREVLQIMKEYVMVFQSADTMVHQLHEQQFMTYKSFLACFMKAEHIALITPKTAKTIKFEDEATLLKLWDCFVGSDADRVKKSCGRDDPAVLKFLKTAREAYLQCAKQMQKTLPLNNKVIKSLAALHPVMSKESLGSKMLKRLALDHFDHLLTDSEKD